MENQNLYIKLSDYLSLMDYKRKYDVLLRTLFKSTTHLKNYDNKTLNFDIDDKELSAFFKIMEPSLFEGRLNELLEAEKEDEKC